ncbi:MAG: rhodanese-like domain-containing protein [Sideroxyarcus sp.]|nr:rhodanese-like domain-containing protein [Sideroxyarcus sp.]
MTKRKILAGLAAAATMTAISQIGWAKGYEVKTLSVEEALASGALVVDIRNPEEWRETGVIEGAKLVTFRDPESFLAAVGDDLKDGRDLVLVCRSGRRTAAAAGALAGTIPNTIISLDGGMGRLMREGLQTVPPK